MKVYVDELPKSCWKCIFADNQKGYCDLQETRILRQFTKRDIGCPLQSLADYTNQVRKEVIEQVKDYMENHSHTIPVDTKNRKVVYKIGLTRFLDQIQGE